MVHSAGEKEEIENLVKKMKGVKNIKNEYVLQYKNEQEATP
jgi:hypothetical protein